MMMKVWNAGLLTMTSLLVFATAAQAQQQSCETDFNGDGVTDEADVEILRSVLGAQASDEGYLARVDLNGDGAITIADYGILLGCN